MASNDSAEQAIREVLQALEVAGVPYMVTGSFASTMHGAPRATQDIDLTTGWKIDFILRKSRPFSLEEFDRRYSVELLGSTLYIASSEDVVLAKLEWAKLGESDRQIEDVVAQAARSRRHCANGYILRYHAAQPIEPAPNADLLPSSIRG